MPSAQGCATAVRHPFARVPRWAWIAFAAAVTAWSSWYLTTNYRKAVALRIADAKAWTIEGPPCPGLTEAAFVAPRQARARGFEFEGVAFYRRHGHATCAVIREKGGRGGRGYDVCQFTSPGDLMVRAGGQDWYFRPGPGQPATISLAGGTPRCVLASKFTLRPPA